MSYPESSIQWALTKLKSHLPLSCSTPGDPDPLDDSQLATLLLSSISNRSEKLHWRSKAASQRLAESCVSAAQRLRDICAATGRVDYNEVSRLADRWQDVHAERTRVWAEDAFASVRATISGIKPASSGSINEQQKKPTFNHEYTPLLEKYFEYNAYPPAPDRALLARKSMMTPRQIEVWFQNHRNRAKKEGKLLRRLAHQSLPEELNLGNMPYFSIQKHERQNLKPSKSNILSDALIEHVHHPRMIQDIPMEALDPPRPLHAFPAVYSKRSQPHFSVEDNVFTFPPPEWRRKPSQGFLATRTPIDMNALILDFNQKLHLRTAAPTSPRQSSQSWCAGRTIIPCPAPLPSLLRQSAMSTPPPFLQTSHPASSTLAIPYAQNSFISSHVTPFSTFISPSPRRMVACLPKRIPPTLRSRQPSATSQKSPTPSPSSSRSSSLSSDSLSRRSSSSLSVSEISSAVTTPEKLTILLPGSRSLLHI